MNITRIPAIGDTVTFRPAVGDDVVAGQAEVVGAEQRGERTYVDLAIGEERRDGVLVVASFADLPIDVDHDGAFVETLPTSSTDAGLQLDQTGGF